MHRRTFKTLMGGVAANWSISVLAQSPLLPKVGFVSNGSQTRGEAVMLQHLLSELVAATEQFGTFLGQRRPVLLGEMFGDTEAGEQLVEDERFDGIPTMVTQRELRMLGNFFAVTPMRGPVLEIGCYLGGSRRAIARGLLVQGFDDKFLIRRRF